MEKKVLYLSIFLIFTYSLIYAQPSRTGKDRALFFAVNDYSQMNDLRNPIQNANDIAGVLELRYGFQVEVIANPTFEQVEQKILAYQQAYQNGTYARDGQLFLFFSGHGVKRGNNGYFMPADADPDRPYAKGVEYDFWRSEINNIDCKHILVAIDACHSITFDPNWQSKNDRKFSRPGERYADQVIVNHDNYRARLFFTSDAAGDQTPDRSTFARQLLEGLRTHHTADGYLTSSQLFANYMQMAAPTPGGGHFGDDEVGSCFLFFPKGQKTSKPAGDYAMRQADIQAYKAIQSNPDIAACQQYLTNFPKGEFRTEVSDIMAELQEEVDWEYAELKDTKEAYQAYLKDYPSGKYASKARAKDIEDKENDTKPATRPLPQTRQIAGKIEGKNGRPVAGADILIVGTTSGTTTNSIGKYKLQLPAGKNRLKISAKGFKTKYVEVSKYKEINVVLEKKVNVLKKIFGDKKDKDTIYY